MTRFVTYYVTYYVTQTDQRLLGLKSPNQTKPITSGTDKNQRRHFTQDKKTVDFMLNRKDQLNTFMDFLFMNEVKI